MDTSEQDNLQSRIYRMGSWTKIGCLIGTLDRSLQTCILNSQNTFQDTKNDSYNISNNPSMLVIVVQHVNQNMQVLPVGNECQASLLHSFLDVLCSTKQKSYRHSVYNIPVGSFSSTCSTRHQLQPGIDFSCCCYLFLEVMHICLCYHCSLMMLRVDTCYVINVRIQLGNNNKSWFSTTYADYMDHFLPLSSYKAILLVDQKDIR